MYFVLPTPLSAGYGPGYSGHSFVAPRQTVFRVFCCHSADSLSLGAEGDLGKTATRTAYYLCSSFRAASSRPNPPRLLVVWQWISFAYFFMSFTGRSFFSFLGIPCRLRSLAVQRCGSGL